jgi:hypothetical protein
LILAGYGVDQWLRDAAMSRRRRGRTAPAANLAFLFSAGTILGLMLVIKLINSDGWLFKEQWPAFSWWAWGMALGACCLLGYTHSGKIIRTKNNQYEAGTAVTLALLVLMLDLLAYQTLFQLSWPRRLSSCAPIATQVYPFKYQRTRKVFHTVNPRVRIASKIVNEVPYRLSVEAYHFMLLDMGIPREYPNYYWLAPVYKLIENCFPQFNHLPSLMAFLSFPGTPAFFKVFALTSPKLHLVSDIVFAQNHDAALEMVSNPEFPIERTTILENVGKSLQQKWKNNPAMRHSGRITVSHFSFNEITMIADVKNPAGAWLYYADAYHPGWHAEIDRKAVPVYPANMAFKAVFVPAGSHKIRFYFWNGLQNLAGLALAFSGIVAALILFIFMAKKVLKPYA